jgi:pyrimidine operon attenuation protein/uracil phosphoribosyltransferase
MSAYDQHRAIDIAVDKRVAGISRLVLIGIRSRGPIWAIDLAWMVNHIASNYRFFSLRSNMHTDMAWRVSGCGL